MQKLPDQRNLILHPPRTPNLATVPLHVCTACGWWAAGFRLTCGMGKYLTANIKQVSHSAWAFNRLADWPLRCMHQLLPAKKRSH